MGLLSERRQRREAAAAAAEREKAEHQAAVERGEVRWEDMWGDDRRARLRVLLGSAKERVADWATQFDVPTSTISRAVFRERFDGALMYGSDGFPGMPFDGTARIENLYEFESWLSGRLEAFDAKARRSSDLVLVRDWKAAEEVAAHWMRKNGWRDARVTQSGPDVGVDVSSKTAVAQVKWFGATRVGRPAVQQIRGTAGIGQVALFFACADAGDGHPYTREAIAWARANKVRLYSLDRFGDVRAIRSS